MVQTGQVRVLREDISYLSAGQIHFTGGSEVAVDALITATGFSAKPSVQFAPADTHSDLGVPSTSLTPAQQDFWAALDQTADLTIGQSFPRLLSGPHLSATSDVVKPYTATLDPELNYTPFRLYRAIAPPGLTARGDHSLVFVSMFANLANTPRCELQCLWAYAYLNDRLAIDRETVFSETALMARYAKFRAPFGHGRFFPDLVFDQVPYFDTLLQDLGLKYWRKPHILAELFGAYRSTDYRGVVQEWMKANGPTERLKQQRDVEKEPLMDSKMGVSGLEWR